MADCILLAVARKDTLFTQKTDVLGNPGMFPKVLHYFSQYDGI
jgi:hypothetical protein